MNLSAKFIAAMIAFECMSLFGGTKLSKAVIADDFIKIKESISSGEKVNELDKWGWTPLMWSVYYNYSPVTNLLFDNGADPNIQSSKVYRSLPIGVTPLIIAISYGFKEQVKILLTKGAKIEIVDNKGLNAKDYATDNGDPAILGMLNGTLSIGTQSANSPSQNDVISDVIIQPKIDFSALTIGIMGVSGPHGELAESLIGLNFIRHGCQVYEREKMNQIVKEHQLALSGLLDETHAIEVGKLIGVNAVFIGSTELSEKNILRLSNNFTFSGRLIDVESGKVLVIGSSRYQNKLGILTGKPIEDTINDFFHQIFHD